MTDPDKKLTLEELEAELNALKVPPDAEPQLPSAQQQQTLAPPPEVPAGPLPLVPGESAKYRLPDMHPEGRKFLAIALAAVLFSGLVLEWTALSFVLLGIAIWVAAFFRDPVRVTPIGENLIVSPADGLVSLITNVEVPRQLLGEGGLGEGLVTRVTVFMNVFDVHVNRAPIAGRLTRIVYVPGKFLNADLDKASEENERQYFVMEDASGVRVAFTQIAGLVARRIMKWVDVGQALKVGERFGLIRFGSRVDVFLPAGYVPAVAVGQRAIAGETVLAVKGAPLMQSAQAQ
ncbi:phosphatidylserine decarboxylase [Sandarakinorhabdus limnophila]|jgi:phosphatidylserine decarboxylase|uniref:phosphatidylserine decarboxylase n=1 Tax=Sandarakinorhabdus limnophila TaxID=210512 RepID=UPI0003B750B4|nr:phosphatidylserine decarboxylase [Sandarakinorhabdus limnophila]